MNIQMLQASTTIGQLQRKVDTLANNIANLNTPGYKRREATFQEALTMEIKNQPHAQKELGRQTPYGVRIGSGALLGQTTLRYEQGAAQETGRPLDFMIEGERVFFRTMRTWLDEAGELQSELLYTRDGSFHLTPDPEYPDSLVLTTAQGYYVLEDIGPDSTGLPVRIDANYERIEFDPEEAMLRVYYPGYPDQPEERTLNLALINRPDLFETVGENHFRLPGDLAEHEVNGVIRTLFLAGPNAPDRGLVRVRQGAVEMSNVDLTTEMSELMATQRLMQFQARAITIADEMMGLANSIRG